MLFWPCCNEYNVATLTLLSFDQTFEYHLHRFHDFNDTMLKTGREIQTKVGVIITTYKTIDQCMLYVCTSLKLIRN